MRPASCGIAPPRSLDPGRRARRAALILTGGLWVWLLWQGPALALGLPSVLQRSQLTGGGGGFYWGGPRASGSHNSAFFASAWVVFITLPPALTWLAPRSRAPQVIANAASLFALLLLGLIVTDQFFVNRALALPYDLMDGTPWVRGSAMIGLVAAATVAAAVLQRTVACTPFGAYAFAATVLLFASAAAVVRQQLFHSQNPWLWTDFVNGPSLIAAPCVIAFANAATIACGAAIRWHLADQSAQRARCSATQ